ncbi:MAG: class I SAM-dependent methyltransferase [Candidatus Lambdaproteobacteria bacterium]|nr:class I SAM-dependent methyltransferase [Candidatus Lambdaproteobacteria bacterium]
MTIAEDRLKWNRRYREGFAGPDRPEPPPLALRWAGHFAGGPLLDAACGLGRGIACAALAPPERPFAPIYAVDLSEVALRAARRLWADVPGIRWIAADVAALRWPSAYFGLVCAFGFTDQGLLASLPRIVRAGGLLLYEGFSTRQREVKPGLDPAWTSAPAELERLLAGWRMLSLEETAEPPFRLRAAAVHP